MLGAAGAVLGAALALGLAALWNGYPLVFYDSGDYIAMSFTFEPLIYRTIPYAFWLAATHGGLSLWATVAAQCLATAWLLHEALAAFAPTRKNLVLPVLALALALSTGLPWYAGQIMPDVFAGFVVLGLAILCFDRRLPAARRTIVALLVGMAALAHLSHLFLAAALTGFVLLMAALLIRWGPQARPRLRAALLTVTACFALQPAINYVLTGRLFYSEAHGIFLVARMAQDGLLQQHLDRTCPGAAYSLCGFRTVLPATANEFLWQRDSILVELGGWYGLRDEAARMVFDSVRADPVGHARAARDNTAAQLSRFATGEGLYRQWQVTQDMVAKYFPHEIHAYRASRQYREQLDFAALNRFESPLALLALAGCSIVLIAALRRRRYEPAALAGMVLAGFIANAAICGILSNPSDRYQGRVAWLPVFCLGAVASWRWSGQKSNRWSRLDGISMQGGQTIRNP